MSNAKESYIYKGQFIKKGDKLPTDEGFRRTGEDLTAREEAKLAKEAASEPTKAQTPPVPGEAPPEAKKSGKKDSK